MISQSKGQRARVQMAINAMRVEGLRSESTRFIQQDSDASSETIDYLASEPYPRERVAAPIEGQRCPRCHRRIGMGRSHPCALCAPMAIPAELYDLLVLRPQG